MPGARVPAGPTVPQGDTVKLLVDTRSPGVTTCGFYRNQTWSGACVRVDLERVYVALALPGMETEVWVQDFAPLPERAEADIAVPPKRVPINVMWKE